MKYLDGRVPHRPREHLLSQRLHQALYAIVDVIDYAEEADLRIYDGDLASNGLTIQLDRRRRLDGRREEIARP